MIAVSDVLVKLVVAVQCIEVTEVSVPSIGLGLSRTMALASQQL